MKKLLIIVFSLFSVLLIAGCQNDVNEAWTNFDNTYAGESAKLKLISSEVLKKGTVDPKKITVTSSKERWKALLVKFKYRSSSTSFGMPVDSEEEMLVYWVKHPEGKNLLMWRGEKYIDILEEKMKEQDFR